MTIERVPRRRSWLRRLAIVALVALALLAVAWWWVVPPVVAGFVTRALRAAGFRDARVQGVHLSLGQVVLTELVLGEGASLRVGRVHATFRLGEVLRGRVREVVVEDAAWAPGAVAGRSFAPFDELNGGEPKPPPAANPSPPGPLPDVPVARLELRRIRVVLPGVGELVCDAQCEFGDHGWRAELSGRDSGEVFAATLALRREGAVAAGDLSVRLGDAHAPLSLTGPVRLEAAGGGLDLTVALRGQAGGFTARLGERGLRGEGTAIDLALRATRAREGATRFTWDASVQTGADGQLALVGAAWPEKLQELVLGGTLRARSTESAGETAVFEVADLALHAGKSWGIDGVATTVRFADLGSPRTLPAQVLRWSSVRVGELSTRAGEVTWQVRPGPVLAVDHAGWAVDDLGRMAVSAFELDPAQTEIATTLTLDSVQLDQWLDFVSQGRVHGDGRVSGQVTARVRLSPLDVEFGGGNLRAIGGGALRFLDDAETRKLVETYVAAPAAAAVDNQQDLVKQRIVESLKDFEFRELTFDLVPKDEHLDLRSHVVGRGRQPPHQELDLNINLNGFDELVDTALAVKLGLDQAKQRAGRILAPTTLPTTTPTTQRRSQ